MKAKSGLNRKKRTQNKYMFVLVELRAQGKISQNHLQFHS